MTEETNPAHFLEILGPASTDSLLRDVLESAWENPFSTKSNFAREEATFIGMATELGYITLKDTTGQFGTLWRITPEGLYALFTHKENLADA